MADFIQTTWVDGTDPAITAAQLNRMEAGILDAVRKFKTGTLLARPAANAASQYWAYFATDDNGGTLYINFDAANWTKITPGIAALGAGGWFYDNDVSAVAFQDVSSLSGDVDIEYEVVINGQLTTGGTARNITVRPNNITANTYNFYETVTRAAGVVSATPAVGPYDAGGLFVGYTPTGDSLVTGRLILLSKSGRARQSLGELAATTGTTAGQNVRTQGRWDDTATVINSLRIDFGGGTFSGRVRVRKV